MEAAYHSDLVALPTENVENAVDNCVETVQAPRRVLGPHALLTEWAATPKITGQRRNVVSERQRTVSWRWRGLVHRASEISAIPPPEAGYMARKQKRPLAFC